MTLSAAECLIVAADFKPDSTKGEGRDWVKAQVLNLADDLAGLGMYLKVNSALRAAGYGLIDELHERGLKVFADLKLVDIPMTMATDGAILREANPELLTVMGNAGYEGMQALRTELPETEVLGVTALTNLTEEDTQRLFGCSVEEAVMRFALEGAKAGIGGLVCSPAEAQMLANDPRTSHLTLNTPAIRPHWHVVQSDDQNPGRVMTPARAIKEAKARRLVVGRPVTQAKNRRDAAQRTLDEIAQALAL